VITAEEYEPDKFIVGFEDHTKVGLYDRKTKVLIGILIPSGQSTIHSLRQIQLEDGQSLIFIRTRY
jgi:hypothetical protein